jgi:hypothetical protein
MQHRSKDVKYNTRGGLPRRNSNHDLGLHYSGELQSTPSISTTCFCCFSFLLDYMTAAQTKFYIEAHLFIQMCS